VGMILDSYYTGCHEGHWWFHENRFQYCDNLRVNIFGGASFGSPYMDPKNIHPEDDSCNV
jgi:hypothetical protein